MAVKTTKAKAPKTENSEKVVATAIAGALQEARASLVRARAARADDFDMRDASLSFVFDLWKANITALATLRASNQAQHADIRQAAIWMEHDAQRRAEEILNAAPETAWGAELRAAVLIEHLLPILEAQSFEEWDMLSAIIAALRARRHELGLAPFTDPVKTKEEPFSTKLLRAIGRIGDALINNNGSDAERIIAALRVVGEAEAAAAAR